MTLDHDGKLGIGTNSPDVTLDIESTIPTIRLTDSDASGTPECEIRGGGGDLILSADRDDEKPSTLMQFQTDGSTAMTIDSSQQVGIGTTSPRSLLDLGTNNDGAISSLASEYQLGLHAAQSTGGDIGRNIGFIAATGGTVTAAINSVDEGGSDQTGLVFITGNASTIAERVRIDQNGSVGINVTTPANVLEILNTSTTIHPASFRMTGAHQYASSIMDNDGANGSGGATFISCRMSNGIKGDIVFNGSVMVYGGQSDYRLKENVVSINDGIAKIKQLNPLRYNFIDNPSQTCEGFFAHEAQAVCPQSATGTKDEIATEDLDSAIKKGEPVYQQMDYSKLVPLLTAGLKEAIAKIETLETKVATLESA